MNRYAKKDAVYIGVWDNNTLLKNKAMLKNIVFSCRKQVEVLNDRIEMAEVLIKQIDERTGEKQ